MTLDFSQNLFSDFTKIANLINENKFHDLDNMKVSRADLFQITISITHSLDRSIKESQYSSLLQYYTDSANEYKAKTDNNLKISDFLLVWKIFSKESNDFMKKHKKKTSANVSNMIQ